MIIPAPAKINLTLRILGKRPDGFHELESLMQMVGLADTLTIDDADTLIFTCSEPALESEKNLVVRAARAILSRLESPQGARIHLEKTIPAQAGLGGGSSDAAAALLALNEFWELRLPQDELINIAASLGSDVPFFLDGPTAIARGRGERLESIFHNTICHLVIAKPTAGLPTPEVYARLNAPKLPHPLSEEQPETAAMLRAIAKKDPELIAQALVNDLEGPALSLLPELFPLREKMIEAGCLGVLLSGSGSAMLGICPDDKTAARAAIALRNDFPFTWGGPWIATR